VATAWLETAARQLLPSPDGETPEVRVGPVLNHSRSSHVPHRTDRRHELSPGEEHRAPNNWIHRCEDNGTIQRRRHGAHRRERQMLNAVNLLTPAELAAQLRIGERTVARMVADGCPSQLVGRRRRFDLADVLAWNQSRECPSVKTPKVAGTPRPALPESVFTDASRQVHLRVMPGASKRS
jgi:excisionase family DNA binding protein